MGGSQTSSLNHSKDDPANEPRNGLLLCPNHRRAFEQYRFYIRLTRVSFPPHWYMLKNKLFSLRKQDRVFAFVNQSGSQDLAAYDKKAIVLDIDDVYAPFPSIFIVHEMRVTTHNPFQPMIQCDFPNKIPWQDWIYHDNALLPQPNSTNKIFKRTAPDEDDNMDEADDKVVNAGGDNFIIRMLSLRSGKTREHSGNTRQQASMAGTSRTTQLNEGII